MPDKAFIVEWSGVQGNAQTVGDFDLLCTVSLLRDTESNPQTVTAVATIAPSDNVAQVKAKIAANVRAVAIDSGFNIPVNAVIFPDFSRG